MSLINALIVAVSGKNLSDAEETFGRLEQLWAHHDVYKKDV